VSDSLEIKPVSGLNAVVEAPPSKAYTLRALFISALADGKTIIEKPLLGKDQLHAISALQKFGVKIESSEGSVEVEGSSCSLSAPEKEIFVGNSGVTARFLAGFAALAEGRTVVNGDERMQSRPIQELLDALRQLGVKCGSVNGNGCPPFQVEGHSLKGGRASLDGGTSSQFFSSILVSAPCAESDVSIECVGEMMSKPYIDLTLDSMKEFGVKAENSDYKNFFVQAGQRYNARKYQVEGDYSSASYFFAAAAITNGKVRVNNLNQKSVQGDKFFLELLEKMGCSVRYGENFVEVQGAELKAIDVDMGDYPDLVPTAAVVAAFAEGTSCFRNIAHLKFKESDRIEAPAAELKKMGVSAEAGADFIEVQGGKPKPAEVETYNDHRIAMAFAVAGLAVAGVRIKNPKCVAKSFPGFFEKLEGLR